MVIFPGVPDNSVENISQLPTLDNKLQKNSELTHKIMEVNIYRGNTEYYCQVYKWLLIIKYKGVWGYLKSDLIDLLSVIFIASTITQNDLPSQWFSGYPIIIHDGIKCIMCKEVSADHEILTCMQHKQAGINGTYWIW